jgi:ketosteroid isomerase-like protein
MKNFLFIILLITSSVNLHSQAVNDELVIQELTRDFMSAYNNQDHKTLRGMYSEYATRIDQENNKMTGADEIINFFKQGFINNNNTLILKHSNLTWSDAEHGFIAHGTYEVTGKTHVYDIKINTKGAYANTLIKDKGKWKIANSVLSPIAKVIITQEVKDFAKFKSNFEEGLSMRLSAGELSEEMGTLHEQPNMVYIISEWTSIENFQSFYSNPDLKAKMKEAGVIGEPTVLILGKQK